MIDQVYDKLLQIFASEAQLLVRLASVLWVCFALGSRQSCAPTDVGVSWSCFGRGWYRARVWLRLIVEQLLTLA